MDIYVRSIMKYAKMVESNLLLVLEDNLIIETLTTKHVKSCKNSECFCKQIFEIVDDDNDESEYDDEDEDFT
jgi:hypothetical protein